MNEEMVIERREQGRGERRERDLKDYKRMTFVFIYIYIYI